MPKLLIKLEFGPSKGAIERTDEALGRIAAGLRSKYAANEVRAHGRGDRFVASAKVEADNEAAAEPWGRSVFYGSITDALPDWQTGGRD